MSLTGNWDQFRKMISELHAVAGGKLMRPITGIAEGQVEQLYEGDFVGQHDPWGNAWEPAESGKTPVLVGETAALANPQITSTPGKVSVKPVRYWVFHQAGAHGMKQRAVLPFGVSNWNPPIEKAIDRYVKKHFKSADSK